MILEWELMFFRCFSPFWWLWSIGFLLFDDMMNC